MNQPQAWCGIDDFTALAAAVRANEAHHHRLDTAVRLAAWAAGGKPVTTTGVPRPADAASAARACGLAVPSRRITRAAQVPGLIEAWDLALVAGLLEITGTRASGGPNYETWPAGPDENVLGVWLAVFGQSHGFFLDEDGLSGDDDGLVTLNVLEQLARGPQPAARLRSAVEKAVLSELDSALAHIRLSVGGDPVARVLTALEGWGVVEKGETGFTLTPLGAFACRQFDLDPGEQLDPALDAAGLLTALTADPDRGPRAATAWLGARTAHAAAQQLLGAAATAGPAARLLGVTLVHELDESALPAWKEASELPGVGAYARMALWEAEAGPEPDPADAAWLAADLAATLAELGEADVAFAEIQGLAKALFNEIDPQATTALRTSIRDSGHPTADVALALLDPASQPSVAAPRAAGSGTAAAGYHLKITLRGLRPPIWRRIEVSADVTLGALHQIIQQAMGWDDYHMHVFESGRARYGRPDSELGHRDESRVKLSAVLAGPGDKLRYEYDFGDGWEHEILLEKIVGPVNRPRCLAGKRHCPPEDCGGSWGYGALLEALTDPGHESHDELAQWLADTQGRSDFDPGHFDLAEANDRLARMRI